MVHKIEIDLDRYHDPLLAILQGVVAQPNLSRKQMISLLKANLKDGESYFRTDDLIRAYRALAGHDGLPPFEPAVLDRLRLKPVRTSSGVAVVTVLTKPFPCPGECIFCPNDVRMPKSYLADEPGAQRAEQNGFDPYLQTYSRLLALYKTGHPTDKIEVIILGGTWSFYPETYQIWFVKRVFDALHDFGEGESLTPYPSPIPMGEGRNTSQLSEVPRPFTGEGFRVRDSAINGLDLHKTYNQVVQSIYVEEMRRARDYAAEIASGKRVRTATDEYATWDELEAAHRFNENAACRCVGLVVETRPDHISVEEVLRIRRLGCTKVQIGFQSLSDPVLAANQRGHDVAATRRAVRLLRMAGFKIHAHWMPNLYGSSPDADIADYERLFSDPDFCPDELKIYPCSLIASAELMQRYADGSWQPYTREQLVYVLAACLRYTPEYCRLTRIIRDIPGTDIVAGNRVTNLREVVEADLARAGESSHDIRAREIRRDEVQEEDLSLDELRYLVSTGQECFLQFITHERKIAGFLRLSLPDRSSPPLTDELAQAAIIREVHVYGQALPIGDSMPGKPQHLGLGTRLIARAASIAVQQGYMRLAVISAVGTRGYYRQRGFSDGVLYQTRPLPEIP